MAMHPQQFSAADQLSGTSTAGAVGFGFDAAYLRMTYRGSGTMFYDLRSTVAGTSGGAVLTSGETFDAQIPQCNGLGLATLSTGVGIDIVALR